MNTTRKRAITLLHDDFVSGMATWWKAFFLAPLWLYPLLPALGGALWSCGLSDQGTVILMTFSLCFFATDLLRKRLVLTEKYIRLGIRQLPITAISMIEIKKDRFKLPNILILSDASGRKIKLFVSRLTGDGLQVLIDTVQKLSPHCMIDPGVDEILRRKKTVLEQHHDTLSTVSIDYNQERVWSDLPGSFMRILRRWSRFMGPLGVLACWLPFSIWITTGLFRIVQTNWARYEEHTYMYDGLIAIIKWWQYAQGAGAMFGMQMVTEQLENPFLLGAALCVVLVALLGIGRALFSPNRITMDSQEISLDRWTSFWSYNIGRLAWNRLEKISFVRQGSRQLVSFVAEDGNTGGAVRTRMPTERSPRESDAAAVDLPKFHLDLNALEGRDRARLLRAIKRFAPECQIDAELIDLLEPTGGKSYTQLWLQSLSAAPEQQSLEPIKAGTLLEQGRYEVIRRLGVGGQGTAYLCYDLSHPELERAPTVALKETLVPVFVDNLVRQRTIEQFVAEAKLLEAIDSPHVVKLLDYFIDSRGAYLVLEHIEGQSLRQLVNDVGALPPQQVRELTAQMLEILETLHNQEIIHRDFTPDNLILKPDGTLKLIDFNVAQEDESESTTATIVGKHAYVPPEQFRGKPCKQSDLYALGATLYYLLVGHDPEPISQSSLPQELALAAPELDRLVRACTALDTAQRAESASQVRADLNESPEEPGAKLNVAAQSAMVEPRLRRR